MSETDREREGKLPEEAAGLDLNGGTDLPLGSYDDSILNLANELATQLGLSRTFSSVTWQAGFERKTGDDTR